MFLNWTKFGRLSSSKRQNTGSGLPCAEEHAKLWHLSSVITALKLVNAYGARSQKSIAPVTPLAISGMPIKRFFQKKRIEVWAKTRARQIIWNAGIALYDNGLPGMFAKPCRSRKLHTCIIL